MKLTYDRLTKYDFTVFADGVDVGFLAAQPVENAGLLFSYFPPSARWVNRINSDAPLPLPSNFIAPNIRIAIARLRDILRVRGLPVGVGHNGDPSLSS